MSVLSNQSKAFLKKQIYHDVVIARDDNKALVINDTWNIKTTLSKLFVRNNNTNWIGYTYTNKIADK